MSDNHRPGLIALIGSGETTRYGGQVFEHLIGNYPHGSKIAILETPAGFEVNSPDVAGKVGDYLRKRLNNYKSDIQVIPARRRGTDLSPDNPVVIKPIADAALVFMGPGSPSYAVRQLKGSLAWELIRARFWQGASLVLASAAAISIGKLALPVYEIFKVGEDAHWLKGLDFLKPFGLKLVIIPHWNNREGGEKLDTSRCFMGIKRFNQLYNMLPEAVTLVGIDELTSLIINLADESCTVLGSGWVHLIRRGREKVYAVNSTFRISEMGEFHPARSPVSWTLSIEKQLDQDNPDRAEIGIPQDVVLLVKARQLARNRKDWKAADLSRMQIESLGWQVKDTSEGPRLFYKKNDNIY